MSKYRPQAVNNYVTLDMIEPESGGGNFELLFVPDTGKKVSRWGTVTSVGEGVPDFQGVMRKPDVTVGQNVYIMNHGRQDIDLVSLGETDKLHVLSVLDIMAYLVDKESMKIQPLGQFIEVEVLEETKEINGLFLPDTHTPKPAIGRVVTLGTGWENYQGMNFGFHVEPGDLIAFDPFKLMVLDMSPVCPNAGDRRMRHLILHANIMAKIVAE